LVTLDWRFRALGLRAGPRRRFCNCLVTSAARSFARMPPARPPRARRLVHVHVELEADAKVFGFGCHRVGSGALP
jgi:hypothetical protein